MKRSITRERRQMVLGIAGLFSAGAAVCAAFGAEDTGKQAARREANMVAGEKEARKLLLLMDKDQNGKVSKQEFMGFMEAEFVRLDKDKNGELDVKELTESRVRTGGVRR